MANAMKANEFRGMSDEQLDAHAQGTEKNLFHLRFQSATDRLETPSEIRKAKRDIARIKTIQRERRTGQRPEQRPASEADATPDGRRPARAQRAATAASRSASSPATR